MSAPVFDWDNDDEAPVLLPDSHGDGNKFSQAFAMGNQLIGMYQDHQGGGKKKKKGKKGKQQKGIEKQIEALFVTGCAYLGIKLPPVVTKQVIKQVLSQCQQFPQAQQLFALLGYHDQHSDDSGSGSGSGSDSDSGKKKKKKKSKSSSGSSDDKHKKKKKKKSKSSSGSSSGSESDKHKKKHKQHGGGGHGGHQPAYDGPLPWAGANAPPGAYGGYQAQPQHPRPVLPPPQQNPQIQFQATNPGNPMHPSFPHQAPPSPGLFDTYQSHGPPAASGGSFEFPSQPAYPPSGY